MTPKNPHRNSNNGGFSLELWWCVVVLLVCEVGAQAVGNRVENTKHLKIKGQSSNPHAQYNRKLFTHPRCNSGVTDVTADLVAGGDKYKYKYKVAALKYTPGGAPPEPGEDDDPGDDVEDGGEQGEDHLQLHEGERQLHLGV